METRAKKMKFSEDPAEAVDVPSMDPMVKLHEFHLQELILQHLNGREVIESMKVSQTWNEILSNSPKAMSKIQLKFAEQSAKNPPPGEVTKLLQSERRYQYLNLNIVFRKNAERKLMLLQRFSPTLVNLKADVCWNVQQFAPKNLQFPRLKSLSMMGSTNWLLTKDSDSFLLSLSGSLTHLYIGHVHCHQIETAINSLPKLQSFGFSGTWRNIRGINLQPNYKITELDLEKHSQNIVKALVNLENYKVFRINFDDAEWIFMNKLKLKQLRVNGDLPGIHQLYQELKGSGAAVNRNIEITSYH
jgi:hypothetical protein